MRDGSSLHFTAYATNLRRVMWADFIDGQIMAREQDRFEPLTLRRVTLPNDRQHTLPLVALQLDDRQP